jgi:multiple sugar transport system substrate-binding protein
MEGRLMGSQFMGAMGRRRVIASGAALSGAVALAACGPQAGGGSSEAGAGTPLEKRPTTKLEFWGGPPAAGQRNDRQDQIDFWNKKYPNIQVDFAMGQNSTSQGVQAVAAIVAAVAAGTPPDVIDFDRFQTASYAIKGIWHPLDDFIKKDKYDTNRFAPLIIPEAKGLDGKWYAMIRSTDTRMLYWNKEAFQEVGLNPDKAPATWDEFKQAAIRVTKKGGPMGFERLGFTTQHGQAHYHVFAWQNGGSFQTADGKKATLPDGKNQEALQWMADLMKDIGGWGPTEDYRKSWGTNAQDPFIVNQVAMLYSTDGTIGTIAQFRPDMKFGVAPPPARKAGDKPMTWSGGHGFNMTSGSKNKDVSWEFMKWLISEEGFTIATEGNLGRAKALGNTFVVRMTGQPELDKKLMTKYKTGIPALDNALLEVAVPLMQNSRVREPSIAAQHLWDGIKKAQTEGISMEKTVRQTLDENQVMVQKELDQAWASAGK